ncbi:6-bladed beta-propeller [Bacteroidota bacterium]
MCYFFINVHCQNNALITSGKEDGTIIQWISQYPPIQNNSRNSFLKSLFDIIFGTKIPEIKKPISVYACNPDSLWIVDQGNRFILEVKGGKGKIPFDIKDWQGSLSSLVGICSIGDNEILFTDSRENKLFKLLVDSEKVIIINDSIELMQTTGIAYSKESNKIWLVETAAHRISILDLNGKLIERIGKRGNDPGEFNFPTSIWIDKEGYAYIVDALNYRIQIFDKNGNFISLFGEIGDSPGYFARPKGIATDSYGNIYITDALFHVVQIFDKSGNFLYRFGSQGRGKEQFWLPSGIFIDDNDYIYIADSYNARIQIFRIVK